jgi:hypothetical protein
MHVAKSERQTGQRRRPHWLELVSRRQHTAHPLHTTISHAVRTHSASASGGSASAGFVARV